MVVYLLLPVVIDTNKSLFTSYDKNLDDRFIYLLTQEGINDPTFKKLRTNCKTNAFNKTFFVESPGQTCTYQVKTDIPTDYLMLNSMVCHQKIIQLYLNKE